MKTWTIAALLIPSLCITVSCTTTKPKRMPVTPQPMACAEKGAASITLYSPAEARLNFENKSYDLNRIETASGVKYGNSDITYWNKGIDALITRKDGSVATCTYVPKNGL